MDQPAPPRLALVVEDDDSIRELLTLHLESVGFEVRACGDGSQALDLSRERRYDAIVLDVMLPGMDGVSVCRQLRAGGPNTDTPVLMVTALDTEPDKVLGLESGADDYLVKPFGIRELLARITAITRRHKRSESAPSSQTAAGIPNAVQINPDKRTATVRGLPIDLTKQEFDLLHRLVTSRGIVFSRAALLQAVWSDDSYVTERTVDSVISRLRKKVEQDPQDPELILTAWGVGYKFAEVG